jgi:hypothetical protein
MEGGGAETFEMIAPQGAILNGQTDQDAAPNPAVILSLDEAEIIAARRLRELAIRLGDGDADNDDLSFAASEAPFNADRMFLDRLAERISSLGSNPVTAASSEEDHDLDVDATGETAGAVPALPYMVTDALPLSAYGHTDFDTKLLPPPSAGDADTERPVFDTEQFDAALDGLAANDGETAEHVPEMHADEAGVPVVAANNSAEAARLVDLINEQRTLLNRLTYLSSTAEMPAPAFVSLDALADILPASSWSDAEQLFEAGTHKAEPVQVRESHVEEEEAPPPISAEELIAALGASPSPVVTREPAPAAKILSDIRTVEKGEPAAAPALQQRRMESSPERAPMIIERARAEMSAVANGEVRAPAKRPSGAIGFAAGLSLSLMVGIVLYHML